MNLFYIKNKENEVLIGSTIYNDDSNITIDKINELVKFYDPEKKLVGFNILDYKNSYDFKPGRIMMTPEIANSLNKKLNANIEFKNFYVVGKVLTCEKIEGTHLSKTTIDIKSETLQIVCGASNVRVGINVVVALVGAIMNDGTPIKPGKLRGVDSFGMLCSARELGLQDSNFNQEGIIELDATKYPHGDTFKEVYSNKE